MRAVAIVVIAVFLLSLLYRWNSRQAAEETVEVEGGQRLCEVRASQAGLAGECELVDEEWVPVDSQ